MIECTSNNKSSSRDISCRCAIGISIVETMLNYHDIYLAHFPVCTGSDVGGNISLALYCDKARCVLRLVVYGGGMSRLGQISALQPSATLADEYSLRVVCSCICMCTCKCTCIDAPNTAKEPDCLTASDRRGFFNKHTLASGYIAINRKNMHMFGKMYGV